MPHVKEIVGALNTLGKARHPSLLPEGMEGAIASGKQLVGIALVSHIPHKGILGTVKNPVEGDGKLYHPKITGKMTTIFSHHIDYCLPYLLRQLRNFLSVEPPYICRRIYRM